MSPPKCLNPIPRDREFYHLSKGFYEHHNYIFTDYYGRRELYFLRLNTCSLYGCYCPSHGISIPDRRAMKLITLVEGFMDLILLTKHLVFSTRWGVEKKIWHFVCIFGSSLETPVYVRS